MIVCIMRHVLYSTVISRRLPFLNDDDDGAQQKDEDDQTSGTHPENQAHLLGVLGHLQGLAVIFAGRWKHKHKGRRTLNRRSANARTQRNEVGGFRCDNTDVYAAHPAC